jgi:hypothetical protein
LSTPAKGDGFRYKLERSHGVGNVVHGFILCRSVKVVVLVLLGIHEVGCRSVSGGVLFDRTIGFPSIVLFLMACTFWPQQGCAVVGAMIYNVEVEIAWKHVLVDQMHTALLWGTADLFAIFDEAVICFFAPIALDTIERVVSFGDV